MKNFVALDFETAIGKNPCSIGIVEFEKGKIVSQYYSLINPMIDEFNPIAVRIHGIKREHVVNQRNFQEIWEEIKHYFVNKTIVCHQSSTDISILKFSLEKFGIETPNFESICTLKLSRAYLNLNNNKLSTVAKFFNVTQNNHHNALEDALVCGMIYLNFLRRVNDLVELRKVGCYSKNGRKKVNRISTDIEETQTFKNVDDYFIKKLTKPTNLVGLKFVVSGVFNQFSRPEIKKSIEDNGGKVSSSISKKTSYIVAGDNMGPSKRAKAESLNIPIISETDYLKMLEN